MTHRYHPDPEVDDPQAILYDDCADCMKRAEDLFTCDPSVLRRLIERTVEVEFHGHFYSSKPEAVACRKIFEVSHALASTAGMSVMELLTLDLASPYRIV